MAKSHGGKRVGAGRKAKPASAAPTKGIKSANYNARIDPETFAAMELAARDSGLSVAAMAGRLIKSGLKTRREASTNDSTRALTYLLGELAGIVAPKQIGIDWRDDPFFFDALKLSFVRIMDAIRPAGEATPPDLKGTTFWGDMDTAQARAEYAATILLHNLNSAQEPTQLIKEIGPDLAKQVGDTPYALHDAWLALNKGKRK